MTTKAHTDHYAAAAEMRSRPLEWVLVCKPKGRRATLSQVQRIKNGDHKAYRTGTYEVKHDRDILGNPQVWARWIGGPR